ncbi:MAG: hypothetical protein HOE85_09545, partial [Nitrospinaceae bacterium]|nr:hypothetical protein [Nitrospinaceae bacterium]
MLSKNEFETRLMEYIQGDLPDGQKREMTEYILAHPEEGRRAKDLETLMEISEDRASHPVPENLLGEVEQSVSARLAIPSTPSIFSKKVSRDGRLNSPIQPGDNGAYRRQSPISGKKKVISALTGIAAILLLYLFANEYAQSTAFAEALSKFQEGTSFQVEGAILTPGGRHQAFQMWLKKPQSFRIEIGEPGEKRIITHNHGGRLIALEKSGRYYLQTDSFAGWSNISEMIAKLTPPTPLPIMPGITKEDRGDITRYIATKSATDPPKRFTVEIDRIQRRMVRCTYEEKDRDQWILVSDLSYTNIDIPLPDTLFTTTPPVHLQPIAEEEAKNLWFEHSFTIRAAMFPTSLLAATLKEDCVIELLDPPADADVMEKNCDGGACQLIALNQPVDLIFGHVSSRYDVVIKDPVLQQQTISLKMQYRDGLSQEQRLSGLNELLGVKAVVSPWLDKVETEVIFEHDGSAFPISRSRFYSPPKKETLENGQVRYWAKKAALSKFIMFIWCNSSDWEYGKAGMSIRRPKVPGAHDPVEELIDIDLTTSGLWADNSEQLRELFGVTYQEEQHKFRTRHIELSP